MKAIGRLILVILIVIGGWLFVHRLNSTTPWAVGTGSIGGTDAGTLVNANTATPAKADLISQVANDPKHYEGQSITLDGRVHGYTKYASNRNMYTLQGTTGRVLVIDDKADAPQIDRERSATGIVHVLGAPIGPKYAYLYAVSGGAKYEAPSWTAIAHFFTDKVDEMKKGADGAVHAG